MGRTGVEREERLGEWEGNGGVRKVATRWWRRGGVDRLIAFEKKFPQPNYSALLTTALTAIGARLSSSRGATNHTTPSPSRSSREAPHREHRKTTPTTRHQVPLSVQCSILSPWQPNTFISHRLRNCPCCSPGTPWSLSTVSSRTYPAAQSLAHEEKVSSLTDRALYSSRYLVWAV